MALTQISTAGVKDDAVTSGKIPANAVGSSELADNAVDTAAIATDAVTGPKIADDAIGSNHYVDGSINAAHLNSSAVTTSKLNNNAVDASKLASNAVTSAKIADDAVTTNKIQDNAVSTAKINGGAVTEAKIGTNAVTNSKIAQNSVTAYSIADATISSTQLATNCIINSKIGPQAVTLSRMENGTSSNDGKFLRANNGASPTFETVTARAGRNVIINGDCQVAQYRGNAGETTGVGYLTTDRWKLGYSGHDEDLTQEHRNNSSGAPFELGLTHSFQVKNGNQTSTGAGDYARIVYTIESQHMRNSGWDYKDSNSYATLSFWVKSSVSKNFYGQLFCQDTPFRQRSFETGTLSANTWTKVEIAIPGDSNINFDHNAGPGLIIYWYLYAPTNYTSGGNSLNTWMGNNGTARVPTDSDSWWTTDNATFDITGVQLEAGATATPFEMKSYDQVLHECKRYYQRSTDPAYGSNYSLQTSTYHSADGVHSFCKHNAYYDWSVKFETEMRVAPTLTIYGSSNQGDIHIEQVGIGSSQVDWNNNTTEVKTKGFFFRHIEDSYGTSGSGNGFGILAYTVDAEF